MTIDGILIKKTVAIKNKIGDNRFTTMICNPTVISENTLLIDK
jgi:hypothetical protein